MNFLTRTIANRSLFSSSSPKKCQLLLQTLTSFQQSSRFASTTRKSKITRPHEPSSSYVLTPPKVEAQNVSSSWPRPREIPFQTKVANCVNLVGFVKTPVHFEAPPDGKYFAGTVIVHENNDDVRNSVLTIPVVFLDDLAHVVACHVKQNDCVYVSGKFSVDPLPYEIMDDYQGIHIIAENVNFVQGLKRKVPVKGRENLVSPKIRPFVLDDDNDKQDADFLVKEKDSLSAVRYDDLVNLGQSKSGGGFVGGDDWRDLIKNPKQWWDCRKAKLDGIVKARFPDFKKKDGSISLWLKTAPFWVLEGVEGLECDVYAPKPKGVGYVNFVKKPKGVGKDVDSWKDLLENPDKWWDNRSTKLNPKAPDFKHKNSGIGLWVDNSPDWVSSQLPPLRDQQAASSGNRSF